MSTYPYQFIANLPSLPKHLFLTVVVSARRLIIFINNLIIKVGRKDKKHIITNITSESVGRGLSSSWCIILQSLCAAAGGGGSCCFSSAVVDVHHRRHGNYTTKPPATISGIGSRWLFYILLLGALCDCWCYVLAAPA